MEIGLSTFRKSRISTFTSFLKNFGVVSSLSLTLMISLAISAGAQTRTLTVLHAFTGGADGGFPAASVTLDSSGNLYGTTQQGGGGSCGNVGCGAVFKIDNTGTESILHTFTGGADGGAPWGVIRDGAGNLYGNAAFGAAGIVFKLSSAGKETVLYAFAGGADGAGPRGNLARDAASSLYGTTLGGGDMSDACIHTSGCGTVFRIDHKGKHTVLHTFTGAADGGFPGGGVILDSAGNIYGTTSGGGEMSACDGAGCGVLFKIDLAGTFTVLYAFTGGADAREPSGALILDTEGNLYGAADGGNDACFGFGCGTIFRLDPNGIETVLHRFAGNDGKGQSPSPAALIRDTAGNIWGTTEGGGVFKCGIVYRLDPAGTETVLHNFSCGADGGGPLGVIRDKAGNFYGTTIVGGSSARGTVFKVSAVAP